jgi:hypothetical protein
LNDPARHLWRRVAALIALIIVLSRFSSMEKLFTKSILISALLISLLGCAGAPSPEQQARDADQQKEAERQQAEFRKSLPPVANPGQGW